MKDDLTAVPERPEQPVPSDRFSSSEFSSISDIKFQPLGRQSTLTMPLITLCCCTAGSVLWLSSFFLTSLDPLLKLLGSALCVISVPLFFIEQTIRHLKLAKLMKSFQEPRRDIARLRDEIGNYLSELDRRTSRYFHCVTNTKVTTYFMLRQIENALHALFIKLETLAQSTTARNLFQTQELFKGTLQYRDGFEFNSGKKIETPIHLIPTRVQELVFELEKGINALEDEIDVYRVQILGPLGLTDEYQEQQDPESEESNNQDK